MPIEIGSPSILLRPRLSSFSSILMIASWVVSSDGHTVLSPSSQCRFDRVIVFRLLRMTALVLEGWMCYVLPRLLYGLEILPLSKTHLDILNKFHMKTLRNFQYSYWCRSWEVMQKKLSGLSISINTSSARSWIVVLLHAKILCKKESWRLWIYNAYKEVYECRLQNIQFQK
jgi:hypothetical protein